MNSTREKIAAVLGEHYESDPTNDREIAAALEAIVREAVGSAYNDCAAISFVRSAYLKNLFDEDPAEDLRLEGAALEVDQIGYTFRNLAAKYGPGGEK